MRTTVLTLMASCLLVACSGATSPDRAGTGSGSGGAAVPGIPAAWRSAPPQGPGQRPRGRTGIAAAADTGELYRYRPTGTRRRGAYTWHLVDLSEAHAFHAAASGELRLRAPDGRPVVAVFDRLIEHPSGNWTWVGHQPGRPGAQTILTFGPEAAYGTIAQGDGAPPLRLTIRDGAAWIVETDPTRLPPSRPGATDFRVASAQALTASRAPRTGRPGAVSGSAPAALAGATLDLAVGYTPGFAAAQGGDSAALTRIQYLLDVGNTAFANSGINARIRLVKALKVNYTDLNSDETALEELSGYASGSGTVPTKPAFDALRAAREQYGADLVTLVRDFQTPENDGCGIAWLLGGSLQGIDPDAGWDQLAYSVVSDGIDADTDGSNYFCADETLVHEIGHNLGAAHDVDTSKGDDGVLDKPGDYGAYTYSFGYKSTASNGNFYTIMAYGGATQSVYLTFSTPDSNFCGGRACGTAETDNARTLRQTVGVVSGFRGAVGGGAIGTRSDADFDGDGAADLFWRNPDSGEDILWPAADRTRKAVLPDVLGGGWIVAAAADFDGDGDSDVLWRSTATGDNMLWPSADRDRRRPLADALASAWVVAGAGDFDGDGAADLLWRNIQTGDDVVWPSANRGGKKAIASVPVSGWRIAGIGDFDGDGRSDLFWRNVATGENVVWPAADRTRRRVLHGVPAAGWFFAGVGDFDGDGAADVLWRDGEGGSNVIWPSADRAAKRILADVPKSAWVIAQVGDYTGDGRSDVFWRNTQTGDNVIWPSANRALRRPLAKVPAAAWTVVP